jgi:hypothetical protein
VTTRDGLTGWVDADRLEQPQVFVVTHEAPPGGMKAFGRPDPTGESAMVPGGTPLRLDQTRGSWGKVTNADGVSGWVNPQQLVPLNAPPTARCPYCTEALQPQAIVCRWCGRDLPGRGADQPQPPPA